VTGLLFGVVPAWHSARDRFAAALNQGGRGQIGDGGGRLRRALVVGELALALMLLVGGGLLIRTLFALQHADLGFNPDRVLTGFVLPPQVNYRTGDRRLAFYDAALARAAALPGVKIAALSSVIPLGGDSDTSFEIEGQSRARTSAYALITWYRNVSANYFAAMEIPLRRGRLFRDREAEPTVVVNETMARRFFPNDEAVGHRVRFGDGREAPWFTIVGVVGDVQVRGARGSSEAETYVPYWHNPEPGINLVLKTAGEPAALVEPLRRAVKETDRSVAIASVEPMNQMIAESVAAPRFYATLVAIFAALALALAAVGIYGVFSYAVAQRTQEIGVRLALGAARRQIFGLVLGESLTLAAMGLALGMAGALVVGRALRTLLYGVGAADAATFAATVVALITVVFVASYVPARRAMRVDPTSALRAE